MKKETKIIHPSNYKGCKSQYGSVNPPIVRASTVAHKDFNEIQNPGEDRVIYGRYGLEPAGTLKRAIAELEGAYNTILTSCGLQAVTLGVFSAVKAGDHVIIADGVYVPSQKLGKELLPDFGVEVSFFDAMKPESLNDLIKDNTVAVFFEVPSSGTMEFPNIEEIINITKKHNILSIVDNTWGAGGYLVKPMDYGVDISIQSLTKYPCGHSDVLMGAISVREKELWEKVNHKASLFGSAVSPDDIYLLLRGLKTMPTRLNQHHDNAIKVAKFLKDHDKVDEVFCPALETSPGHENWKKYCTKTNGLFSFTFKENYG
ncbi:MAG: trans-sulfuration enzyme family protein, partial [Alphaproteobacteria bacterium]